MPSPSPPPIVSAVIPTYNPDPGRLRHALAGLRAQTLADDSWETIIVDNASTRQLSLGSFAAVAPPNTRLVHEPTLGLTAARRRGLVEAKAPFVVFVDDDNVLAPDYLAQARRLAEAHPRVGAFGGRCEPEFDIPPPAWTREFFPLLALRDLGDAARIATGASICAADGHATYPIEVAPIGAGMVLCRAAVESWLRSTEQFSDRRGRELSSGGDNEIVFAVLGAGWDVAYFPELRLRHLIPEGRLTVDYLGRINRGIQRSWVQVLTRHHASPWPRIPGWTVPLRQAKAWFKYRAWSGAAAWIRWQGACGHFEGRRR